LSGRSAALDSRDDRVVLLGSNPLRASAARTEEHSGLLGAPRAGSMASNPNPLQQAAAAGAPSIAVAYHPHHQMSQRTQMLGARVAQVKAQRLTCFELLSSKGLGTLFSLPFLGLTGLISIPAATSCAIFRFGKLDCVISEPGLTWVAPFYERVQMVRRGGLERALSSYLSCAHTSLSRPPASPLASSPTYLSARSIALAAQFTGTQTHKMNELNLVDAVGNPILVRALLEFSVEDPAALFIATNASLSVLFNQAEQVVREACTRFPLLGEKGADIRSLTHELGAQMLTELQPDASVFGVQVQRLVIVEARYSPNIASQMLMKQQAMALIGARKEIVQGALHVVRDTLTQFPDLGDAAKERLIGNLLITLTAQQQSSGGLEKERR